MQYSNTSRRLGWVHRLQTPFETFLTISQTFGQIGRINFGVFLAPMLALWVPCSWFPSFSCCFYERLLFSDPSKIYPKYDIGQREFRKNKSRVRSQWLSRWYNLFMEWATALWTQSMNLFRELEFFKSWTWKAERMISR